MTALAPPVPVPPPTAERRSARVAHALRSAIAQQRYPVGSPLPTEMELCRHFAVGRHTVRAALKELSDLGLVARRQGSGTQVVSASPRSAYVQSMRSLQELTQYARDTILRIDRLEPVALAQADADLVPAAPGSTWMRIDGVRWDAGETARICVTTVFVHMRFREALEAAGTFGGPIYALVEARSGERIVGATQDVTAHLMPRPVAKRLAVPAGQPALRFVRRYLDASGVPMVASVNWHAAEGFTYSTRLSLDERYAGA
ncbi:putative fructoselysine utilization operon transcriptional repressor [Methylobacterium crusticola]|uniref:Fructoselysine utilization operon transcriptional repressor n=1 Tax=Methylobacterium crusticola TaxID=1697972 RepID=A0ABQ4R5U8_9HYPH|nr:GntR family transcriptional regulator [Methylobacterium crusticola]GJD52132.1 putative fructoselysine utilization operon transcriptional repressor [Methylobacterium crusticola]